MNIFIKTLRFVRTLGRDERGEDLTEGSSALSNIGKVVIAAAVIGGAAGGATALTTSATRAGGTVSTKIAKTVGAPAVTAEDTHSPFTGGHGPQ